MADPRSITINSYDLGPRVIKIGSTNLGTTEGGVTVELGFDKVPQFADQYDAKVNSYRGHIRSATAKFKLLESSYANLQLVMWGGTTRSTGGTAVGFGGKVPGANDAQTDGATLNMHKAKVSDATLTDDINMWKCVFEIGAITYGPDGVAKFDVTAEAHLDTSKAAAGNGLIDFGLTAAT